MPPFTVHRVQNTLSQTQTCSNNKKLQMAEITKQTTDKIADLDHRRVGKYFGSFCIILITEAILSRVPESVAIFIIPINTTDLISSACDSHRSILETHLFPPVLSCWVLSTVSCLSSIPTSTCLLSSSTTSASPSHFLYSSSLPHPLLLASTAPFPPVTSPLLQY